MTLMIVGDGPERRRLESLAKELGVDGKIVFTGMLHAKTSAPRYRRTIFL